MSNIVVRTLSSVKSYALTVVMAILKMMQDRFVKTMYGYEKVTTKASFYELVDKNMNREDVPLSMFRGNVLLIVNVASK